MTVNILHSVNPAASSIRFYRTMLRRARYCMAIKSSVCLSVRPSVTSRTSRYYCAVVIVQFGLVREELHMYLG